MKAMMKNHKGITKHDLDRDRLGSSESLLNK